MGIQKEKAQMRLGFQNIRGLNSMHMSQGFEKFSKWGVDFLGFSDSKTSKEDAIGIKNAARLKWAERSEKWTHLILHGFFLLGTEVSMANGWAEWLAPFRKGLRAESQEKSLIFVAGVDGEG